MTRECWVVWYHDTGASSFVRDVFLARADGVAWVNENLAGHLNRDAWEHHPIVSTFSVKDGVWNVSKATLREESNA